MSLMVNSFSLIQPSLHPIPSMNLFWGCLGLGIAFAWAIVGGDAPVHHTKGKLHIENSEQQASSMYASGGIYLDVHCGRVFVNCISMHVCMYVCARVCILCMCSLCFITCILTLRGFGCQRKQNTGGSAVRRRAEKRCSHNKAPRGSLCMQHTAAVRLARSAARPWRATWMPGQPCAQLSGTYCVSVSCAPSDQQQAVPVIPRTLEDTL